ncbi:MAG: hypothetical protein UZ21_OP11001000180 [Microgenomates bacterium OLB22]|nr:MAG: hypothetical protein UZ21_OP11001000180 [Microgenomates bacterium OLB22]
MKPKFLFVILGLITFVAAFLRLYQFEGFVTFLGDQGRDAIVFMRMMRFEHFPLVGASSSVGHVLLGPFYYYYIAPWIALTGFSPVGPALGVALLSTLLPIFTFFLTRKYVGAVYALSLAFVMGSSHSLIWLSRFSWNPNLIPVFIVIWLLLWFESLRSRGWIHYLLSGLLLGAIVQMHYLTLVLGLPIVITFIVAHVLKKSPVMQSVILGLSFALGFVIAISPLIIFDLRHQFVNTNAFIRLFSESANTSGGGLSYMFDETAKFALLTPFASQIMLSTTILAALLALYRRHALALTLLIFFVTSLLSSTLFKGVVYMHYIAFLIVIWYLMVGVTASLIDHKITRKIVIVIVLIFAYYQIPHYWFLREEPNHQIRMSRKIAESIMPRITKEKYQITGLPDKFGDSTYRYWLEKWGKTPVAKDSLDRGDELFVACQSPCRVIGDPQWDIAYFAPTKIVETWQSEGVTLYKLIR